MARENVHVKAVEDVEKTKPKEKRGFNIHGHEFWLSKDQIENEFGCPPEDADEIWEGGKKAKPKRCARAFMEFHKMGGG